MSHQGSFVDVAFLDRIDIIECVAFAVSDVFLETYYILHNMYIYIYHVCVSETTRKPSQTYFKSLPDRSTLIFCDHTTLETSAIWFHPNGNKNPPDVLLGDNKAVQTVVACSKHDHICTYVSKVLQLKSLT